MIFEIIFKNLQMYIFLFQMTTTEGVIKSRNPWARKRNFNIKKIRNFYTETEYTDFDGITKKNY